MRFASGHVSILIVVGAQVFKFLSAMSGNAKAKVTTLWNAARLVTQAKLVPIDLGHWKS